MELNLSALQMLPAEEIGAVAKTHQCTVTCGYIYTCWWTD